MTPRARHQCIQQNIVTHGTAINILPSLWNLPQPLDKHPQLIVRRWRIQRLHPVLFKVLIGDGEDLRELERLQRFGREMAGCLAIHHTNPLPLRLLVQHLAQLRGNPSTPIRGVHTGRHSM